MRVYLPRVMVMKFFKSLFIVYLFFIISCCTSTPQVEINTLVSPEDQVDLLRKTSFSLVKIKTSLSVSIKNEETLVKRTTSTLGSGVIIDHYKNSTLIMTAGHLCTVIYDSQVSEIFGKLYSPKSKLDEVKVTLSVKDFLMEEYPAELIAYHKGYDLCIIATPDIPYPAVKIHTGPFKVYENVYYQGFPGNIGNEFFKPTFEGRILGLYQEPGEYPKYVYNLLIIPGASGSPVFNYKGEIIGIISAYVGGFNSISISSTSQQATEMLNYSRKTIELHLASFTEMMDILREIKTVTSSPTISIH